MRLIFFVALLVGCASAPVPQEPPLDAAPSASHQAVRPEPSFAAKRLGAESGALVVKGSARRAIARASDQMTDLTLSDWKAWRRS